MKYMELIDSYKDDITLALQGLLSFDSVVREGEGGTPFGIDVQKSLDYMLQMAEKDNFTTLNTDNRCGHIEFGQGEEILGIFTHLDIVPAGEGWDYDPFGKDIADGKLYGRGTLDDKGPAIMTYFAMKALREAALEDEEVLLKRRVRLILGLDEEQGVWKSIPHYLQKVEAPDFGFTPDSDFPVIHAEMGILLFELVKKLTKQKKVTGTVVKSIKGGSAHNVVPAHCQAVLSGEQGYDDIKNKAHEFSMRTGHQITVKGRGRALEINTTGVAAHGMEPKDGLNAISIMMAFLGELDLQGDEITDFITFYNDKIGFDLNGSGGIGCGLEDEISGKLRFNVGVIDVNEETATLTICLRYPVTSDGEDVYEGMRDVIHAYDLGLVKIEDKKPVYFPPDSKLVTTLLEIYQKHTGDMTNTPVVTSGGTYARAAKNIIAFGPAMPGEEDRNHRINEHIEVDRLVQFTKIYAEAIFRLANE